MAKTLFDKVLGIFMAAITVCHAVSEPPEGVNPLGDDMINYINNVLKPNWTAGRNFHPEMDLKYIQRLCGVLNGSDKYRLPENTHLLEGLLIPKEFDARTKWPYCPSISEIRDQGNCGSCWAEGAASTMTDRYCIAHKGTQNFRFSADNILSCCTQCGSGCQGGYPARAWNYWVQTGVVSGGPYNSHQGCQPYEIPPCEHHSTGPRPACAGAEVNTPQCFNRCDTSYKKSYSQDLHQGKTAYSLPRNPMQIQADILNNGPAEVVFTIYEDFLSYKSGVYHHVTGGDLGGHAVKVFGWGEENGIPYWLMANSWNTDWGDNGFFKIRRGNDECGVEDYVAAGLPNI